MQSKYILYYAITATVSIVLSHVLQAFFPNNFNTKTARVVLGCLWWLGNMADIGTTYFFVKRLGHQCELNWLAAWFMKEYGEVVGLLLFKLIVVYLILGFDLISPNRVLLLLFTCLIWLIVFWNLGQIVRFYFRSTKKEISP